MPIEKASLVFGTKDAFVLCWEKVIGCVSTCLIFLYVSFERFRGRKFIPKSAQALRE